MPQGARLHAAESGGGGRNGGRRSARPVARFVAISSPSDKPYTWRHVRLAMRAPIWPAEALEVARDRAVAPAISMTHGIAECPEIAGAHGEIARKARREMSRRNHKIYEP